MVCSPAIGDIMAQTRGTAIAVLRGPSMWPSVNVRVIVFYSYLVVLLGVVLLPHLLSFFPSQILPSYPTFHTPLPLPLHLLPTMFASRVQR